MTETTNPLLEYAHSASNTLPNFDSIEPQHIEPAVKFIVERNQKLIDELAQLESPTWQSLVAPLEEADDDLSRLWSPVSHLNAVVSNDNLREAHDACLPLLSAYGTFVSQHEGLYEAYRKLAESDGFKELSEPQQRVIKDTLRDFKLGGVALPNEQKGTYAKIQSSLSDLSSKFSNQLLDATHAWYLHLESEEALAGVPESALEAASEEAKSRELSGYVITLDIPSYLPIMMYAHDRELRQKLYTAFVTRASEQGAETQFDNSEVMVKTLALRNELAQLLGFKNYAELSLETKMASSPEEVLSFLNDLSTRAYPQAQRELEEIKEYARKKGCSDLQAWDIPYFAEQLKQEHYAISDEMLRPYFPEQKVTDGLFEVASRLFNVQFKARKDVSTWHPDVKYFEVLDEEGNLRASFYLDLYARAKKRGGAWMADCVVRRERKDGSLQLPVAFLTCNFSRPVGDKPALFSHDEVVTLFHEFGHGLHHMLTQVSIGSISGINGVPWDAVELPSQFLENWCWEKEALQFIAGHYETNEALPDELLNNMLKARNFQAAMQMVRQLEFSLFDMEIHSRGDLDSADAIQSVLDKVREKVAVVIPPAFNRFQHSFGHIFAGGYAAGYYSYKWAEVLSADAYSKFEEDGIFNAQTGRSFLNNILEAGGSEDIAVLFERFRGRKPELAALLRHSGIEERPAA
ncbi:MULTISPECIES: oligopeptidase A [Gammaproteobacteria]|uniref:oligopeptidase A n=1 Tax=Gammaproteobacteria TaxID=1236 RepID=UPI000DD0975D|nr:MULTISPECIES: oligopeptidase A [Gammaproteobacteria]RTE85722.1 oligopeptidase A [Aliidiomarina sp. B3213]TCZ90276.1 oligopeptidase A [Lysobacter sp. N42]